MNSMNKLAGNPFVKTSANCNDDGMNMTLTSPTATFSLAKCMSISMCFVRWWRADVITIYNGSFGDRMSELKEEIMDPCEFNNRIRNTFIFCFSTWSGYSRLSFGWPWDLSWSQCTCSNLRSSVDCLDSRSNQRLSKQPSR